MYFRGTSIGCTPNFLPMKVLLRTLLSALAVIALAHFLPGVHVDNFVTAIWVAIALGIFNFFVKPFLIILTLPITIITLGFFLLVVNALIIQLADYFISGFQVDGLWWAILFSLLLSLLQSLLFKMLKEDPKPHRKPRAEGE